MCGRIYVKSLVAKLLENFSWAQRRQGDGIDGLIPKYNGHAPARTSAEPSTARNVLTCMSQRSFTFHQGRRYRLSISLGFVEQVASNDLIKGKLLETGFTEVSVAGAGRSREASALWPRPSGTGELPAQVASVVEVEPRRHGL